MKLLNILSGFFCFCTLVTKGIESFYTYSSNSSNIDEMDLKVTNWELIFLVSWFVVFLTLFFVWIYAQISCIPFWNSGLIQKEL